MLNPSELGNSIKTGIRSAIKAKYPDAIEQPFQQSLASAVAKGVVDTIKQRGKAIGAVGNPAVGQGHGISGLSVGQMLTPALSYYQSQVGSQGVALKLQLEAIFKAVIQHLASETTVISTSGFGGPLLKISGWEASQMGAAILNGFPSPERDRIKQSKAGKILANAIAQGITTNLQTSGIPGTIPMAGIPVGPTIASFS